MAKYSIVFLILTVLVSSCSNKNKWKRELLQLQSEKVILPIEEMKLIAQGRDTTISEFKTCEFKLVIYADSSDCASCILEKMHLWDSILMNTSQYGEQFKIFFIFSPADSQKHDVNFILRHNKYHYPVFLDFTRRFAQCNPHLPQNPVLHSFLLDENNKVILGGNPLTNKRIELLLYNTLHDKLSSPGHCNH